MPLGEEVGDAYIEVHADTSSFRRELQREAKAAGAAAGRDFGDGMDSELDTQMSRLGRRLRKSLSDAGVKSGTGFSDGLEDAVASRMRRFTANLQESMVSGDWTRVLGDFDSLDKGMDAVENRLLSLRYQGAITEEQFADAAKSLEHWFAAVKNDEAEQGLKRMTQDIEAFGKDFAAEAERVNKELEKLGKSRATKRLKRDLDLADFEAQMKRINDDYMEDFGNNVEEVHQGLRKMVKESAELGDRLEMSFRKKRLQFDIDSSSWDRAFQEAGASAEKFQADLAINAAEAEAKITENLRREYRERMDLNEDFINDRAEFWDREVSRAVDSEKAMRRWSRNAEKEMARLRKSLVKPDMDWLDTEALDRSLARFADNVDRSMSRAGRSVERGFIGRLKGARNDFVNLVGVIGGGLERVFMKGFDAAFGAAGRAVENLGSKLTDLGGPFDRIGTSIQSFGSAIQTMSGGPIGQLVVTLIGFGSALQFMIPILGVVVAGLYGLSGAVTALAVSLGGGILGAVLSLGPMLFALGAGAGAAVIGVMGMTDAMKDSLNPIKEWFDTFKTAMAERLFSNLETQVEGAMNIIRGLEPLLLRSGDKLRKFADDLIAAFSSERMQQIMGPLEVLLPDILGNLLDLVKSLSVGFSALFAAISPIVEQVTEDIAAAADEWAKWVQSAEGQVAIKDFFDKAAKAADALWEIAGNVWDVLKVLFEEGNSTGQEFLDKIVSLTEEFAEWLGSTEGREELQEWFQYAKDVASELGDIISKVKDLWDELNTPTNRELFLVLLDGVEGIVDGLARMAEWVDNVNTKLVALGVWLKTFDLVQFGKDLLNGFLSGLAEEWEKVRSWWEEKWNALVTWFKDFFGIQSPSTVFAGFGGDILNGLIQGFAETWQNVLNWWNETAFPFFQSIPGKVKEAMQEAWDWLWSPIAERWAKVTNWWNGTALPWIQGLPGKFQTGLQQAWDWLWKPVSERWAKVTNWWNGTALPWFQSLPGKVRTYFTNLWNLLPNEISQAWTKVKGWWNNTALPWFRNLPSNIKNVGSRMITEMLDGLKENWYKITNWLKTSVQAIKLTIPTPSISMPRLPWNAAGSIVNGAQVVGVGEAGPEAIVPLNRPLSQVDPSVRWLSAIAQGKNPVQGMGTGAGGGTTIAEGAITVVSNFADSRLVAEDVLSGLVSKFK